MKHFMQNNARRSQYHYSEGTDPYLLEQESLADIFVKRSAAIASMDSTQLIAAFQTEMDSMFKPFNDRRKNAQRG